MAQAGHKISKKYSTKGCTMPKRVDLSIKIFADGADLSSMIELSHDPGIAGFTTNPTLMRKSGVTDYEAFAHKVLEEITGLPISFEVFSDDPSDMGRQARLIAGWGKHVYVKIPITNTKGESCIPLIRSLSEEGLRLNVTAIMSLGQVELAAKALEASPGSIVSVFAGRIADTGVDPVPLMESALEVLAPFPALELLWASPREVLNICQADAIGCHIITVTNDLLKKLSSLGRDLEDFSLETVQMFYNDAQRAGYVL
jgi:transaldolase